MKSTLQIILSTSAASVLAFSALAQDRPTPGTDHPDYSRERTPHARSPDRLNGAAKASDVIGMTVNNYQNEKLGKVDDIALDVESGRIVQVILSTGGLLGIGDTLSAVPPGALHHDVGAKVLHLDASKEKVKGAPVFEMSNWAEGTDSSHLATVYRYYNEEPAFRFIQGEDAVTDGQRNPDRAPTTIRPGKVDGTQDTDSSLSERRSLIPVARLSQVQRASKLMGTPVKNLQDEKLGKVENILVDLPSGRVVAVIVSSGGFLGLGDELSAVPPTALQFTSNRDALQLDASKEMLSNAPHFKANEWPDLAQPGYAHGVYRAYQVEPYFTTNVTTETVYRAPKGREGDNRLQTPLDQGNSQADVNTTAQIRKDIIATENMSVNARNVKIITNQGQVTLRGPVNTAEEKRLIGAIADRIARSENVDNQLVVTVTTSRN